jgi:hypothetical protein
MTSKEMQQQHEAALNDSIGVLSGRGKESDWALIRALVHRAVHLAAEHRFEFCGIATLLAEMTTHAHEVVHPADRAAGHRETH